MQAGRHHGGYVPTTPTKFAGERPRRGQARPLRVPEECPQAVAELQQRCVAGVYVCLWVQGAARPDVLSPVLGWRLHSAGCSYCGPSGKIVCVATCTRRCVDEDPLEAATSSCSDLLPAAEVLQVLREVERQQCTERQASLHLSPAASGTVASVLPPSTPRNSQ